MGNFDERSWREALEKAKEQAFTNRYYDTDEERAGEDYMQDEYREYAQSGNSVEIPEGAFEGKENKKPGKSVGKKIASLILIVAIAFGSGYGGAALATNNWGISGESIKIETSSNMSTGEAIAAKVTPSVVGIKTTTQEEIETFFGTQIGSESAEGTGFVVDSKGYIVTNSHVVGDGKEASIMVYLANGDKIEGKVLWNDKSLDLAVLKINAKGLVAAELGDSDTVKIGAYAGAIGNPLGLNFERSYSQGVISGLNRNIQVKDDSGNVIKMDGLIQTDASINTGNSGGPLLNDKGQVVAINSAKAKDGEGMGFAIPINTAKPIIEKIKKSGQFERLYMGIAGASVSDLKSSNSEDLIKSKLGVDEGIYVTTVYDNSPAASAGVKVGDIIVSIDDQKMTSINQMIRLLLNYKAGDKVKVKIMRDKKMVEYSVGLTTEVR